MIDSLKANIGDCCYFLLQGRSKPRHGMITKIIANESAVQIMDMLEASTHAVWENNVAWEEKELKGKKWLKPHNYIRHIPKEIQDEKEPDKTISPVRNRKPTKRKSRRIKRES